MDHISRIRRHFTESANLKLSSVETLAPQIVRAAEVMTQCLLLSCAATWPILAEISPRLS